MVAIPTSAVVSANTGSVAERNSKLIGGLVGSIGGIILIACLAVIFIFFKKRRRRNITNQSPDFNSGAAITDGANGDDEEEDTSFDDKNDHIFHDSANENMKQSKLSWLKSMFGAGNGAGSNGGNHTKLLGSAGAGSAAAGAGAAGVAGAGAGAGIGAGAIGTFRRLRNDTGDLENQTYGATPQGGRRNHEDEGSTATTDFEYRGVTNANNLESVFRSSGNATTANSGTNRNSMMFGKSTRTSSMSGGDNSAGAFHYDPQSPVQPQTQEQQHPYDPRHTRMNSYGHPLANANDFNFEEDAQSPFGEQTAASNSAPVGATTGPDQDRGVGAGVGAGADTGFAAEAAAVAAAPTTNTTAGVYPQQSHQTQGSSNYNDNASDAPSNASSSDDEFHPSDYDDESFILPSDDMNHPRSTLRSNNYNTTDYALPANYQFYNDSATSQEQPFGAGTSTEQLNPHLIMQQYVMGQGPGGNGSTNSLSRFQEEIN